VYRLKRKEVEQDGMEAKINAGKSFGQQKNNSATGLKIAVTEWE
jgi:hypothetical protein